uniref:Uncharacterized protein n=1 Tax=Romanomermis culicivorax TaxID=13658 RepID=A0A915LBK3_ROMCU
MMEKTTKENEQERTESRHKNMNDAVAKKTDLGQKSEENGNFLASAPQTTTSSFNPMASNKRCNASRRLCKGTKSGLTAANRLPAVSWSNFKVLIRSIGVEINQVNERIESTTKISTSTGPSLLALC